MNINANISSNNVNSATTLNDIKTNATAGEDASISFLDTLKEKLDEVNVKQIDADNLTQKFIKGDEEDVHKVMLSTSEAKLSLEMAVQIRNKLVDAYDAFNRMQI
ncbi:flagellar hook-basal body complex protein FliE [Clostridium lacusfryxellense]|uniref:flagellar hook-basal body complex protein FliE n=1 Tax=Clostridium lacusfryxellense TaxID=205328 RepID=UPI001C0CF885|nr:flagellar hook-basal body complex protein FliE [Clostridium lacusfryxellense]MBU3111779.1 flagellar hook-basal body complex protein FliE [Clostridium lacusfryxellense]